MRTLIIPDIHHKIQRADHWLETQKYDQVIFLGDYFDDFGDSALEAAQTAYWLKEKLQNQSYIFLLGNHDAPYRFPKNDQLYCPGFNHSKSNAINRILTKEDWNKIKLFHQEGTWLFSHAGIHPNFIPCSGPEFFQKIIADQALEDAKLNIPNFLLGAGSSRGGGQPIGGILWMDWFELVPIPGFNQIVGHTPGREVREYCIPDSRNYCIDVMNTSVCAILEDDKLSFSCL